jgi:hypothetical protein
MKIKLTLGWIFVVTGTVFLISGLVVMIFATLNLGTNGPTGGVPVDPGFWATLANAVMEFIIDLLEVDWTPIRVGVFLIMIGVIFDGGGAYLMVSSEGKPKRKRSRKR